MIDKLIYFFAGNLVYFLALLNFGLTLFVLSITKPAKKIVVVPERGKTGLPQVAILFVIVSYFAANDVMTGKIKGSEISLGFYAVSLVFFCYLLGVFTTTRVLKNAQFGQDKELEFLSASEIKSPQP